MGQRAGDAQALNVAEQVLNANLLHLLGADLARHVFKRLGRRRSILGGGSTEKEQRVSRQGKRKEEWTSGAALALTSCTSSTAT